MADISLLLMLVLDIGPEKIEPSTVAKWLYSCPCTFLEGDLVVSLYPVLSPWRFEEIDMQVSSSALLASPSYHVLNSRAISLVFAPSAWNAPSASRSTATCLGTHPALLLEAQLPVSEHTPSAFRSTAPCLGTHPTIPGSYVCPELFRSLSGVGFLVPANCTGVAIGRQSHRLFYRNKFTKSR